MTGEMGRQAQQDVLEVLQYRHLPLLRRQGTFEPDRPQGEAMGEAVGLGGCQAGRHLQVHLRVIRIQGASAFRVWSESTKTDQSCISLKRA